MKWAYVSSANKALIRSRIIWMVPNMLGNLITACKKTTGYPAKCLKKTYIWSSKLGLDFKNTYYLNVYLKAKVCMLNKHNWIIVRV